MLEVEVEALSQDTQRLQLEIARLKRGSLEISPAVLDEANAASPERRGKRIVQRMLDVVRSRYARPMSLGEVSAEFRLSSSYLSSAFHRVIGLRFHQYVEDLRLNRATELLTDTDLSVAAIAARSGYSSDTWFRHAFRARVGLSPSAWRARYATSRAAAGTGG